MLDLNSFVTFSTVADLRSFSRAGEKLGLSKATVSRQVAALERKLGCRLLKRSTRSISLTEAGAQFNDRCRQLISHAGLALKQMEEIGGGQARGNISISAGIAFGSRHLTTAIARFMEAYPHISVHLELGERPVDLIAGDADVAVRSVDESRVMSLIARKLAPLRSIICASPAYLKKNGVPKSLKDLERHNCIQFRVDGSLDWQLRGPDGLRVLKLKGSLRTPNSEVAVQAALAGIGLGLLPTFAVGDYIRSGQLVHVLLDYQRHGRALYAAYLPDRNIPLRTTLLVRFLEEYFGAGPQPYWDDALGLKPVQ
jgi:LysR family transcriptional regulator for bpeEF and oprC